MPKLRKPENNFTMLHKGIYYMGLTGNAVMVYGYMLSKPDGWKFRKSEIGETLGLGHDALTAAIGILRKTHLLSLVDERGEKGQITDRNWVLHDIESAMEELGLSLPWGTPHTVNASEGHPEGSNTVKKEDCKKEESFTASRSKAPETEGGEPSPTSEPDPEPSSQGVFSEPDEEEPLTRSGEPYGFYGEVIRLSVTDYKKWHFKNYYLRMNFNELLMQRDKWLSEQPKWKQKKWFMSTEKWLRNKNFEEKESKQRWAI